MSRSPPAQGWSRAAPALRRPAETQAYNCSSDNHQPAMGIYYYISSLLTGIGYGLLTYKSSFILSQSRDDKASLLEPLGMKWVVFLLFLILEPTLSAVLDIIPFGLVALLAVKCMIVLPENTAATYIYHKIEKQLQKLEFEEYPSKLSIYTSNVCRLLALTFIKACKRLVVYVRTEEMEEIYSNFEETLKALEYKRTAVETRQEIGKSIYRRQLSMGSDLDETVSSVASADLDSEDVKKSDIRESVFMDRVSTTYLHTNPNGESYKVDAKVMTQKPNKDTGIKPQYSNGEVTFHTVTKEVSFRYDGKLQTDTLLEVKYVSKNMMVLELILRGSNSVVIKFHKEEDVIKWMKPVIASLKSKNE